MTRYFKGVGHGGQQAGSPYFRQHRQFLGERSLAVSSPSESTIQLLMSAALNLVPKHHPRHFAVLPFPAMIALLGVSLPSPF